jgi:hypothetical protein
LMRIELGKPGECIAGGDPAGRQGRIDRA